jgi:predicted unusual protein kinase regulating ubiquinone biosynthesis (AarF/ABC1/UbiB family)
MQTNLADLLAALPKEVDEPGASIGEAAIRALIEKLGGVPVPVGRLARMWALGSLKAKIAAAYIAHWVRSLGMGADARQRDLNETHLRAALQLLGSMGYLRGAIMKLGQVLANYPNVVPLEFADVLGRLFFEAPPMHFALLREHVRNELGNKPETLFDDFETEAFAAASFGQVHRARLKGSGRPVAV